MCIQGCKCHLPSIVWPNLFALLFALYISYKIPDAQEICNVVYRNVRNARHPRSARMPAVKSIPFLERATRPLDPSINARAKVLLLCNATTTTTTTYRYRF